MELYYKDFESFLKGDECLKHRYTGQYDWQDVAVAAWKYQQDRIDALEAELEKKEKFIQVLDNRYVFSRLKSSGYTPVSDPSMIPQPDLTAQVAALTERLSWVEEKQIEPAHSAGFETIKSRRDCDKPLHSVDTHPAFLSGQIAAVVELVEALTERVGKLEAGSGQWDDCPY